MNRFTLIAATLATLLSGAAFADDKPRHGDYDRFRGEHYGDRDDDRRYGDRRNGRHWRHVPPAHYRSNYGYRFGYESGWRDAGRYCRFDYRPGYWRHDPRDDYWYFGFQVGG